MKSGLYHRVLLAADLVSDQRKERLSTYWNKYQYQLVTLWRKAKSPDQQDDDIGWSKSLIELRGPGEETEWALESWIHDEFSQFFTAGVIRLGWELDVFGHIVPFLTRQSKTTSAYVEEAYPDLFNVSHETQTHDFPEPKEIDSGDLLKPSRNHNSHKLFL